MAYTKKDLEKSLKNFLSNNPQSTIEPIEDNGGFQISKPWNDSTLMVLLTRNKSERSKLIRSLNKVILPALFSAVYHTKIETLEIIWTPFKLGPILSEITNRSFEFNFKGVKHTCSFGEASKDLLNVAKFTIPYVSASETDHRNILPFFLYLNQEHQDNPEKSRYDKPRTFKISNVKPDEGNMVQLAAHLNFYMTYYDNKSPQVRIHSLDLDKERPTRDRYLHGDFPQIIRSRELDSRVLSFWKPQQSSTFLMQFLFHYRILEFAASQYVDAKIRAQLKILVNDPALAIDGQKTIAKIVEIIDVKKLEDIPRLKGLVKELVDTQLLWKVVETHKDSFCEKTEFEGGYVAEPFLTERCNHEELALGVDKMTDTIRKIRNALSHGKDIESGGVIIPSRKNERLLEPWVLLLEIISGQVILNKDVI